MLEQRIKVISEAVAREIDRRSFLKQMSTTILAGVSALVVAPMLGNKEGKVAAAAPVVPTISCAPPGPYCTVNGAATDGCRGGHCYQHGTPGNVVACEVYYTFYTTGCWTTAQGGGYWTCCDCRCTNGVTCGCAQFTPGGNPSPH